ncbi:MAG: TatD family hydrolase [Cytophagales bacterium]|nr:TatD family hydrolase [Cytophaga sp.]
MTKGIIDTHIHLYSEEYATDRDQLIEQAIAVGVEQFYMPNVDVSSIEPMLKLEQQYPTHCVAMMGLHPCYVKEDYKEQLKVVEQYLSQRSFIAIGEVGLDLHWDKTFFDQQVEALKIQAQWALDYKLPIVIHSREANQQSLKVLLPYMKQGLKGVFHCFSGTLAEVTVLKSYGWMIGIGGVVTFKKAGLDLLVEEIGSDQIILETDGPYLAPVPHRGKRNEPAYIDLVATKVADLLHVSKEILVAKTRENTRLLFGDRS